MAGVQDRVQLAGTITNLLRISPSDVLERMQVDLDELDYTDTNGDTNAHWVFVFLQYQIFHVVEHVLQALNPSQTVAESNECDKEVGEKLKYVKDTVSYLTTWVYVTDKHDLCDANSSTLITQTEELLATAFDILKGYKTLLFTCRFVTNFVDVNRDNLTVPDEVLSALHDNLPTMPQRSLQQALRELETQFEVWKSNSVSLVEPKLTFTEFDIFGQKPFPMHGLLLSTTDIREHLSRLSTSITDARKFLVQVHQTNPGSPGLTIRTSKEEQKRTLAINQLSYSKLPIRSRSLPENV